jgi:uncharacterized repeat protein (TIGR04052 family)
MKVIVNRRLAVLLAGALLTAHTARATADDSQQAVTLRFDVVVAGEAFACGKSYDGIGTTHSRITPSDLRFYVSDVALVDSTGRVVPVTLQQDQKWQYRDVALLDFEDGIGPCSNGTPGIHHEVVGSVPKAGYSGIRFAVGVPFDLNHADPTLASSPLNLTAMFWVWQSGYRFFKLDMATDGQPLSATQSHDAAMAKDMNRPAGFPVHLGSTGCVSASATTPPSGECTHPNHVRVAFEAFDVKRQQVVLDIAKLLADTNVDVNVPKTAPGCMSAINDADCTAILHAFGLPDGSGTASASQRVFQAR